MLHQTSRFHKHLQMKSPPREKEKKAIQKKTFSDFFEIVEKMENEDADDENSLLKSTVYLIRRPNFITFCDENAQHFMRQWKFFCVNTQNRRHNSTTKEWKTILTWRFWICFSSENAHNWKRSFKSLIKTIWIITFCVPTQNTKGTKQKNETFTNIQLIN